MSTYRKNAYGSKIADPEDFKGAHYAAIVPSSGGSPPVCSCGWTRQPKGGGLYVELWEHIRDMGGTA